MTIDKKSLLQLLAMIDIVESYMSRDDAEVKNTDGLLKCLSGGVVANRRDDMYFLHDKINALKSAINDFNTIETISTGDIVNMEEFKALSSALMKTINEQPLHEYIRCFLLIQLVSEIKRDEDMHLILKFRQKKSPAEQAAYIVKSVAEVSQKIKLKKK